MKEVDLIALLERISSEEGVPLVLEEEIQLKEAFSHIPLLDEKPEKNVLNEMEERLFSKEIIFDRRSKNNLHWLFVSVAALIAILFGCGLWITSLEMKYATGKEGQLSFVLPDQSIVRLNENSSAEYNKFLFFFSKKIYMKGEAYYIVTKGRHFTVETALYKISVLGTRFMVSEKDKFDVFCYEGKVKVENLRTNEVKVLIKGQSFSSDRAVKEKQPGFVTHNYEFDNAPLIDAIGAIEKEYKITIGNKDFCRGLFFTGAFPIKDLKLTLDVVLAPYNMRWEQLSSNHYRIVRQ